MHPPYGLDSLSLVTFPDYAPVQIVTDCFARKKASRVNFLERRKAEVQLRRILLPRTPVNKGGKREGRTGSRR